MSRKQHTSHLLSPSDGLSTTHYSGATHSHKSVEELKALLSEGDVSTDIVIDALQQATEDYQVATASLDEILGTFRLNQAELNERDQLLATEAATVLQNPGMGIGPEADIQFADLVVKTAAEARAEFLLASDIGKVRNRTQELSEQSTILEKFLKNTVALEPFDPASVKELQGQASLYEKKASGLLKQIEKLQVPSQSALQKQYSEYVALKTQLDAATKELKQFGDLPPSLAGATEKLEAARQNLISLRNEMRNVSAFTFNPDL